MTGVGSRQWIHFLCQDAHSLLFREEGLSERLSADASNSSRSNAARSESPIELLRAALG